MSRTYLSSGTSPYYGIMVSSETFDKTMEENITYVLSTMPRSGATWGHLHLMRSTNLGFDRKRDMEGSIGRRSKTFRNVYVRFGAQAADIFLKSVEK